MSETEAGTATSASGRPAGDITRNVAGPLQVRPPSGHPSGCSSSHARPSRVMNARVTAGYDRGMALMNLSRIWLSVPYRRAAASWESRALLNDESGTFILGRTLFSA